MPTDQIKQIIRECLGYHWSESKKEELTVLCKFSHTNSKYSQVILFLIIAFIVGAIGNGFWGMTEIGVKLFLKNYQLNKFLDDDGFLQILLVLVVLFFLMVCIAERRLIMRIVSFVWFSPGILLKNINQKMEKWKEK